MKQIHGKTGALILSMSMLLSGCTSSLVRDDVKRTVGVEGHCSGAEWVDDSSIAVLPVPVVAFIVPHFDLHKISGERYLNRCGASTRVINREVTMNRTACIPAGLTRIVTLGIWQWCPAHVSWTADVLAEPAKPASALPDDRANQNLKLFREDRSGSGDGDRGERGERGSRGDRSDSGRDRSDRQDRSVGSDRQDRIDRPDKVERADRSDKPERVERSERPDRSGHGRD